MIYSHEGPKCRYHGTVTVMAHVDSLVCVAFVDDRRTRRTSVVKQRREDAIWVFTCATSLLSLLFSLPSNWWIKIINTGEWHPAIAMDGQKSDINITRQYADTRLKLMTVTFLAVSGHWSDGLEVPAVVQTETVTSVNYSLKSAYRRQRQRSIRWSRTRGDLSVP